MDDFKATISNLKTDCEAVICSLEELITDNALSKNEISKRSENYLCELENLCVKSRNVLDKYGYENPIKTSLGVTSKPIDMAGEMEITRDGWLKITLNALLPNCRQRISRYIGDTIGRLIDDYPGELPYFENAFMAIIEHCNNENHNALDNDNKGWKMIPNALKGSVIEDDNQFILSVGLFTKLSDELKCEVYVLPLDESNIFMDLMVNNML